MKINFKIKNLVLASLIISAIAVGFLFIRGTTYVNTSFSIQFEGIEKGVNPDNTRFDYNDIASDNALKEIFKFAGVEYKDEYKDHFTVVPVLPNGIVKTLQEKRVSGEDYTYFPNEFKVKIKVDKKIGLDKKTCQALASGYKIGYEIYFKDRYSYPFMDLDKLVGYFDYSKYDYPEYKEIFNNEFNIIYSYLNILKKDDSEFRSSDDYTFADIYEGVALLQNLDLKKINALISTYELSKDVEKLRIKYAYMIRRHELEKNKSTGNYEVSQELLNIAKANKKSIIMPGVGGDSITVSVVNDTYDTLAARATDAQSTSSDIAEEIAFIRQQIDKLDNPKFSEFKIASAAKEVNDLSATLENDIMDQVKLITKTAKEYFDYKYENAVTSVYDSKIEYPVSIPKAIVLFLGIFIFLTIVFVKFAPHKEEY